MKILLIEDNPIDSKLFADVLRHAGCEVIQTESAEDALTFLLRESVDVILTDVLLPGMDGLSLANHLRTDDSKRRIPIIAMSAVAEWPFARIARNYGCFNFLQKPVDTRHLAEQIRKAAAENQN